MGVTGLWPILHPCARPTPLPTLNRKRLAVDASIWIYQFLKAVRDKEGNALRNSHVVGFFRRICKLLFFGIKPVFVFDGGAPVLKRQTIQGRKRRREGRREDAVRTAGKLLAIQMQKRGEEEVDRRKRERERERDGLRQHEEDDDAVKEGQEIVYVEEMGMDAQQRMQNRKFRKTDAYHLPELNNGIEGMGQPNDPRIMSAEELEDYARQFHNGEDVNLYDFSKIDFNGEFFMSLPAVDRYNILNAARLRSRLRMGLSKEQLEEMFPDRMAFSRFQIERVRERNELTQRLMNLNGMNGEDGMAGVGRIAGERDREYVLVKNDGVEGGWALGVVSVDKSLGDRSQPIDVDALHQKAKIDDQVDESEDEFEDVPVEGLNRLPKLKENAAQNLTYSKFQAQEIANQRQQMYGSQNGESSRLVPAFDQRDTLFVDDEDNGGPSSRNADLFDEEQDDLNRAIAMSLQQDQASEELDEQGHLDRAIALSLHKNHRTESDSDNIGDFEDVPMPEYEQRAVPNPKPLTKSSGRMVAHIVNNRANAAVPKKRAASVSSDSDMDLQSALAKARRHKTPAVNQRQHQPVPVAINKKNPFDGPLPFEKLDFKTSIFGKKEKAVEEHADGSKQSEKAEDDDDFAGGFDNDAQDAPKPLPPWLIGQGDIRSQVEEQRRLDEELNAEDRAKAIEDEMIFRQDNGPIQIDSSDDGSDVEIVEAPPQAKRSTPILNDVALDIRADLPVTDVPQVRQVSTEPIQNEKKSNEHGSEDSEAEVVDWSESDYGDTTAKPSNGLRDAGETGNKRIETNSKSRSVSAEFEDVEMPSSAAIHEKSSNVVLSTQGSPEPTFEDIDMLGTSADLPTHLAPPPAMPVEDAFDRQPADTAEHDSFDDFSDPDDEELLAQLAVEAEEHARFASTFNHKTERENQEAFERELKQLRNQQKKDRRDADEVSHIMITECQALLRLFGLPYITAPMEAEAQCAELVNLGLVDGVVTDDCDIFLFGGTRVYKNMFNSNKFVECYLSSDIEKELSLSRDQLISLAQLLGSDYTEGLHGVGSVTAIELISEFPSASGLDEFKEWWTTVQMNAHPISTEPNSFRKKFRRSQAAKLFLPATFPSPAVTQAYLKPDVDSTPEPFQWGVPDLDSLREFLMTTIGWNQERTDEVLVPVIRDMNRREAEGTQSNITRYFDGAVGTGTSVASGKSKDVGSKRMQNAVSRLRAKKQTIGAPGNLTGTFGDEAAEWAKKNDLSWTEKEQRKAGKGKGKRKKKASPVEATPEADGDEHLQAQVDNDDEADDESGSGEEYTEMSTTSKGKGKAKPRGNGKGPASKRKRVKI
ncbi:DNA excision repair protein-like protein [Halenospora varia]|nr:DNA excision repair protein-like protein [Halenospora varia]